MPAPDPDPEYVVRSGKIFEAGSFDDKAFDLSPEEMAAAVAGFAPVPVDFEHTSTVLDGQLGELRSVRVHDDGRTLMGEVAIPAWLDRLLAEGKRKVSCTWDRATKRLSGLALVNTPRIPDAALFAAFASAHPDAGVEPAPATFATPRKRDGDLSASMQAIHDHIAGNHPWACGPAAMAAAFGDRPKQYKAVKALHDSTTDHGATCPGRAAGMSGGDHPDPTEESPMDLVKFREAVGKLPDAATPEELKAALALAPAEALAAFAAPARTAPEPEPESPAMREMRAKLDRMEAERESERRARVESDAAAFALEQAREGKILPKAAANLVALFKQAADDDHAHSAAVTFSAGDAPATGSRLDALRAFFADVTPHGLFDARAGVGDLQVLFNKRGPAPGPESATVTDDEHERDLSYTESGRAILAAKKKGA